MNQPVRRHSTGEDAVERRRSDLVQRAENRDAPERLTIEAEGPTRPSGVDGEFGQRVGPAANDDDVTRPRVLVTQVRPQVVGRGLDTDRNYTGVIWWT